VDLLANTLMIEAFIIVRARLLLVGGILEFIYESVSGKLSRFI
jgi:hypothetical protein